MASFFLRVGLAATVLALATAAAAAPPKATPRSTNAPTKNEPQPSPDTCRSAFDCGALSAHLAGRMNDYPGAFRAIKRGCDIETRAPVKGDAKIACEQYAELLVSAGVARGGDPPRGMAMLEEMCKERPFSTSTSVSPCSSLAREYDHPPRASGLPRRSDKAAALHQAACDHGDSLACDALGTLHRTGGPGVPVDMPKARAAMEKGCNATDSYAAGVCGSLGSRLVEGKLGAPPDTKAAMPYLVKSCAKGYRCDLLVGIHLREGREAEAVAVFDKPSSFFFNRAEWARKFCNDGHQVMCSRAQSNAKG